MNSEKNYELQCLLELLAVVINQEEEIPAWQRAPEWGRLYKLADYHHVANVVYGPIISMNSKRLDKWKESFEERYHYAVITQERYREAEKLIADTLEKAKIHCLELEETILNQCYSRKENRYPLPVKFLIQPGKLDALRAAMRGIDFEETPVRGRRSVPGEYCFSKTRGMTVYFYEKLDFTNKKMNKYFLLPPQSFRKKKGRNYVHVQDVNDFYLYYISWLAERYARGAVEIRDILDLWQCYMAFYEKVDWKETNKEFKRMDIDWFAEMIVKLAAAWFGELDGFEEDLETLHAMERYIISKGTKARAENEKLLPLVKEVADVYERDLKKERRRKQLELWFPDRNYMMTLYPSLEKHRLLLPVCWISRLIKRQLKKVKYALLRLAASVRRKKEAIRAKLAEKLVIIQKIKERFKKNKENENNP